MKTFHEEFSAITAEIQASSVFSVLNEIKSTRNSRPLVLYGAGRLGKTILNSCHDLGIDVDCFCDRRAVGAVGGVKIISPDLLRNEYSTAIIIVCSWTYNNEICDALKMFGFSREQIIPCPHKYPYYSSLQDFEVHFAGYEWAYNFFEDDRSRQLVLDRIRLILCDRALAPNTASDCYYEDGFITLGDNEIYIDGGAYTGDSAEVFLQKFASGNKQGICRVYSFEPDKENYENAVRRLSNVPNVTIVQKGLWSTETELVFSETAWNMAGSSFVTATAGATTEYSVPVTSLDSYFSGKSTDELPTFIKMDIEGAESEALLGSAEIIKRRKPKLAICAYHKVEDIYELPQTICNIRNDYRFALRQHANGCWDTVLYAV